MTESSTKPPSLARNLISSIGLMIAILALVNIAFLVFMDVGAKHSNPYVGIFAYIVIPGVMCGGLALFFLGMLVERRRRRLHKPEEIPQYPDINLNNPRTRHVVELSIIGISVFVLISVVGSYKAYHYTETDEFCGTTCHQLMHPEFTAYKASPHARVGCVNCHIGSGATWYVKSKLSGAYQVYATIVKNYPRPIPTPVENLRPAQETCEQCHWPEKFWGAQLKVFNHFGYDETNTPRETRLLIKTGGGKPTEGMAAGIHFHMNIESEVTYSASDRRRQTIEWIKVRNRGTGKVTEYRFKGSKISDAEVAKLPQRRMDCVNCHNRPTHIYTPPDLAVDRALLAHDIPRDLPYVKAQAVAALTKDYASTPEALDGIRKDIDTYYSTTYPDVYSKRKKDVDATVAQLHRIFQTIRFPEMKVDWRAHTNNIGHFYYPGCFRCHDDNHVSSDGKVISKECNICHEVLGQKEGGVAMAAPSDVAFQHPVDLGDLRSVECAECHTGASM